VEVTPEEETGDATGWTRPSEAAPVLQLVVASSLCLRASVRPCANISFSIVTRAERFLNLFGHACTQDFGCT